MPRACPQAGPRGRPPWSPSSTTSSSSPRVSRYLLEQPTQQLRHQRENLVSTLSLTEAASLTGARSRPRASSTSPSWTTSARTTCWLTLSPSLAQWTLCSERLIDEKFDICVLVSHPHPILENHQNIMNNYQRHSRKVKTSARRI